MSLRNKADMIEEYPRDNYTRLMNLNIQIVYKYMIHRRSHNEGSGGVFMYLQGQRPWKQQLWDIISPDMRINDKPELYGFMVLVRVILPYY